jgi:actin related protein 2/3 complex subunit 2
MSEGTGGRIHLEAGNRVVAEAVRARIFADPDKREAVDVKADDFDGTSLYVSVAPEQKSVMAVSLFVPCFAEIKDAVGGAYFDELFAGYATQAAPQPGYSLTLVFNLDGLPTDDATRGARAAAADRARARPPVARTRALERARGRPRRRPTPPALPPLPAAAEMLVAKLSTLKRDVVGAPLWVSFKALLAGAKPPRSYYVVPYRPHEKMYLIPSDDTIIVVYSISFENHVEQAIAKTFLHEIVISRRQSKDLMTAPSVTFSHDPPHELKSISGLSLQPPHPDQFIGYVSLAITKRTVEAGRLEKVVTLTEGYRSFLMYHVQATKSQLHTRIRRRSNNWLQVLNRAMPERLNVEKKTIKGRTFNRA